MQAGNGVLVYRSGENGNILTLMNVEDQSIPAELNGESGFHIYHVRMLTELILQELNETGGYSLPAEDVEAISVASSLHDIGKSRIPKSILDFPGKLSPLEYDIVKKHAVFGAQIIEDCDFEGIDSRIKGFAVEIARYHHERYDGTGYPDGKVGEDICLGARIIAVADSFDAMMSNRVYRKGLGLDKTLAELEKGSGTQFDPAILKVFLNLVEKNGREKYDQLYGYGAEEASVQ